MDGGRKTPWLGRDIFQFVDEIEILSRLYKAVFFNIIDSSFEDPGRKGMARMMKFCDEMERRKLRASFKIHLRTESLEKMDDAVLFRLKEAGVDILVIGVESGIDRELQSYGKNTASDLNATTVHRLDALGIFFPLLGHMMFSPFLRLGELRKKVAFLQVIHRTWDYLNMSNNVLVYYGTAFHDLIRQKGLVKKEEKLSGFVTYRYEDDRVEDIAKAMGQLKYKCAAVIPLHNLLYDAWNMIARFSNPMNRHLWDAAEIFKEFKDGLQRVLSEVGDAYLGYFSDVITLAEMGWIDQEETRIFHLWISERIPTLLTETETIMEYFQGRYNKMGLSISTLNLKTWLSLINSEIDTSRGAICAS